MSNPTDEERHDALRGYNDAIQDWERDQEYLTLGTLQVLGCSKAYIKGYEARKKDVRG